jgi:hypothetical protein
MELTDSVDIFSNTAMSSAWKIIVDDMHHICDVKAASSHTSSNQDRAFGNFEGAAIERESESEMCKI